MDISIIGAGFIGGTLGKKRAAAGHTVTFGARNPADPKYVGLSGVGAVLPIPESLAPVEVVLLAMPGAALEEFTAQYGSSLVGKIVIDSTNKPRSPVMNNLEALMQYAPQAYIVRAFSTLGGENFASPQLGGVQIDLLYCGHTTSRSAADQLIADIGLRPVYLG